MTINIDDCYAVKSIFSNDIYLHKRSDDDDLLGKLWDLITSLFESRAYGLSGIKGAINSTPNNASTCIVYGKGLNSFVNANIKQFETIIDNMKGNRNSNWQIPAHSIDNGARNCNILESHTTRL